MPRSRFGVIVSCAEGVTENIDTSNGSVNGANPREVIVSLHNSPYTWYIHSP
jgi:hypothetical protein